MTPRLLTREKAAAYLSVTPEAFSVWVRAGRLPPAIGGTRRWDKAAIDRALDKLSGLAADGVRRGDEPCALEQWKAKRGS